MTTKNTPFLTPTTPPPGTRSAGVLSPAEGTWVRVVCSEGGLTGRVMRSEPGRLRLKAGAGWWDIDATTIVGITEIDEPAKGRSAQDKADARRVYEARQIQRIMDRWP